MFAPARAALLVFLAGCSTGSNEFVQCRGPSVAHPDGKCSAYFYQTDYRSGGKVTQALVSCFGGRLGGGVAAFHAIDNGMGLVWLSPTELEVSVPSGQKLSDRRTSGQYDGLQLRYAYKEVNRDNASIKSCFSKSAG
jgi:hypothetical protein